MVRLDGVEIKVSLAGSQVDEGLETLGLGDGGQPRAVSFLEDATVGVELPLLREGIVLRVRQTAGEDDDATVKLRPCRRTQLTQQWVSEEDGDGWRLRVEEDWAATRRSLAVSCVSDLPEGRIAAVRAGTGEGQRRFLADRHLERDDDTSKTERVLRHLVGLG
jgi:hypothetical protein